MKAVKRWLPQVLVLALLLGSLASVALAAQWTGWILDQKCAEAGMHEGDHGKHVTADNPVVFLNESDRNVFTLIDAGHLETLLGKKVVVQGDAKARTIRVTSIKEIPDSPLSAP
jgi:hypothetical protein